MDQNITRIKEFYKKLRRRSIKRLNVPTLEKADLYQALYLYVQGMTIETVLRTMRTWDASMRGEIAGERCEAARRYASELDYFSGRE